jgi:hypothetical protein
MKMKKSFFLVGLMIAFVLMVELAAFADSADQSTKFTFSQPVQIPGRVLPAGTYIFELADHGDNLDIVEVYSADRTHLYATLQTISAVRLEPTDHTEVVFADQGDTQPPALVKWFYPGQTIGSQFEYPKQEEKSLAQDKQQTVLAHHSPVSNTNAASVGD